MKQKTPSQLDKFLKIETTRPFLFVIVIVLLLFLIVQDRFIEPLRKELNETEQKIQSTSFGMDFKSQQLFFERQICDYNKRIAQLNISIDSMRPYFSTQTENETLRCLRTLISSENLQLVYERKVNVNAPKNDENNDAMFDVPSPQIFDQRLMMLRGITPPVINNSKIKIKQNSNAFIFPELLKGKEVEFFVCGQFPNVHIFVKKLLELKGAKYILRDPVMFMIKETDKENSKVGFTFKILLPYFEGVSP